MNKANLLYELQKVDLEIEAKERDLAQVLEQLGDDTAVQEQRAALGEIQSRVGELEKRRQSLNWENNDLSAKITPVDKKLYSGQVRVPKELLALQQDVEMLKTQRRVVEDAELEIMIEMEEAQRQLQAETQETKKLEKHWAEEQQRLASIKDALTEEIEVLRGQRDALARQVDAVSLDAYQRIRENRQGVAVVTVQRGTCSACRITIPAIEMQRARTGREMVFCQSCGRILLVT
ncbi:MAG: C4-type zinc ribbon domain-containing protein [Dehalococcoidia bacterium]|nr:C4-type zinc ribbon domain-containing protein [Dehalococcoidia bacterium]